MATESKRLKGRLVSGQEAGSRTVCQPSTHAFIRLLGQEYFFAGAFVFGAGLQCQPAFGMFLPEAHKNKHQEICRGLTLHAGSSSTRCSQFGQHVSAQ